MIPNDAAPAFSLDSLIEFIMSKICAKLDCSPDSVQPETILVDLGMDSLDAVLLCGEIEDNYGVEVEPADIFECDTIAAFARSIYGKNVQS